MAPRRDDNAFPAETRRALVEAVYPELRYGDDPDLDRYLELRRDGRIGEALSVYNGALRSRYPADADRALLIALKRSRDPRWLKLQGRLLDALADRLASRLEANVELLLRASSVANARDAWGSLGAVDALLGRLGSTAAGASAEAAIEALERHLRLARILGAADRPWAARIRGLERALGLLEEYAALARFEAPEAQDFVARSRALEERRRSLAAPRAARGLAEESTDFVERSRARLAAARGPRPRHFFDLERIRFSRAEVAAIELSTVPSRHEDLVIAWCAKYWRTALDPRFERSVFLYSRKFGTRHFEVYRELRSARLRKRSDDEILTAMSSLLSKGYSYSVSGDLYMQRRWAAVKASLFEEAAPLPSPPRLATAPEPAPEPAAVPRGKSPTPAPRAPAPASAPPAPRRPEALPAAPPMLAPSAPSRRAPAAGLQAPAPRRAEAPPSGLSKPKPAAPSRRSPTSSPQAPAPRRQEAPPGGPPKPKPAAPSRRSPTSSPQAPAPPRPGAAAGAGPSPAPAARTPAPAHRAASAPAAPKGRQPQARRLTRAAASSIIAPPPRSPEERVTPLERRSGGSISDRVRRLSGRRYDVYRNIFLERVRDSIHRILLASRTRQGGIFDTSANEAEDLVYGFIAGHYGDPFMDWEASRERALVEGLGFSLPSLDPIVEDCYRRL